MHGHAHQARHNHSRHDHNHAVPVGNTAFAVGVALNFGFVLVEAGYGFATQSLALLSDAGHNLGDVFGLLLAWGALHLGKMPPTRQRTYGLRRASILAALGNAVLLLVVVGGITWEALQRFTEPMTVPGTTVIVVAAVGVCINTLSALLFLAGRKHDINVRGAFLHLAADAAVSLGVVVVGVAMQITNWFWLDPAVSLLIAIVIVWSSWGLLRESFNQAMDAVPVGIDPAAVENYLQQLPGVQAVHDLHIWSMSTADVALTVHLVMPKPPWDDTFLHEVSHTLHERFGIGHATVQIERGDVDCHLAPAHVV